MDLVKFAKGVRDFGVAAYEQIKFINMLKLDRYTMLQQIETFMDTASEEQIDALERHILESSLAVINGPQRIRAMELYAGFKIYEMIRYKQFRGFCGPSGPLA